MATVPSGQKFHTVPSDVETGNLGSKLANSNREIFTMADITSTVRPYKVFTALLTQSGGDNPDIIGGYGGTLDVGYTFEIISNPDNYDLTIYGAPNNNAGTKFMCTKSVLNLPYTNSLQIGVNYGAPVATVLENTIGYVWFTYGAAGVYLVNCSNVTFNQNFTYMIVGNPTWDGGLGFIQSGFDAALGIISTKLDFGSPTIDCGLLLNTPIEIRVYE